MLGPWSSNQHIVLFHHPGCEERIVPEVRVFFVRGLYSLDRNHFIYPCVDGHHYWVHVYDTGYCNGPFTSRLWK